MNFKNFIKQTIEKNGWYLKKISGLPMGINFSSDWKKIFSAEPNLIIDV